MKYDVCVFGGCSLDRTFYQKVDGSFNEEADISSPGGKGSNQAVAASRAGAKTTIITRLGNDEIGKSIVDNLNNNNIDTSNVELIDGLLNDSSNIYINVIDKDNNIVRQSGAIDSFTPDLIDKYQEVLLKSKIIACQLKVPKEVTIKLINFCHENNKTLVLTPCRPDKLVITAEGNKELIDKISIITCNKKECETIFSTSDIEECVKKYPNKLIVTLGENGLMYHDGNGIVKVDAIKTDVIDTTGAGDTFNGNFCAFLSSGMSIKESIKKAIYASAMKIGVKTAQEGMPHINDLEDYILEKNNQEFKYKDELTYIINEIVDAYNKVKYSKNFHIKYKEDNSLVTNIDETIEDYLLTRIKDKFNNDNFITQETYPNNKITNRTWVIDALDGTAHFIKKDSNWGIQIAFYDKKYPRFSVIYLPEKKELYYAAEKLGVFLNNIKLETPKELPLRQSVIEFGGSIYKDIDIKKMCIERLIEKDRLKVLNILHVNASCISFTNLLSNKTDALIISSDKIWNKAPGEFMLRELGVIPIYLTDRVKLFTNNKEIINLFEQK